MSKKFIRKSVKILHPDEFFLKFWIIAYLDCILVYCNAIYLVAGRIIIAPCLPIEKYLCPLVPEVNIMCKEFQNL